MTNLVKWRRDADGFRSACAKYRIERFDNIVRGGGALWELRGEAGTFQRSKLADAKWLAEAHARSLITPR